MLCGKKGPSHVCMWRSLFVPVQLLLMNKASPYRLSAATAIMRKVVVVKLE